MAIIEKKMVPTAPPPSGLSRVFERAADFHAHFFPTEIGVDPEKYSNPKPAAYAGVKFYAEQGAIHGVHANVVPGDGGAIDIAIEHWVHRPNGDNVQTPFLSLRAEPVTSNGLPAMRITRLVFQGENLNLDDRRDVNAAVSTCQQILTTLRLEQRMPMIGTIAEQSGLKVKPLPNTYKDGNARLAYEEGRKSVTRTLRIPEHYVPAVTGFFQQGYAARAGNPVIFHAAIREQGKTSEQYHLHAAMQKPSVASSVNIDMTLSRKNGNESDGYETESLVSLRFRRASGKDTKGMVDLAQVSMGGRKQRITDHKSMVRNLHFAHDVMRAVRHGVIPDLGDIISYTNTQRAFSGIPPLTKKDGRRFTTRVLGGNPTDESLSVKEKGIGANCFADHYEYFDAKGNLVTESLVRDVGIMALDRNKTGYDGKMAFAGDYFPHRDNPKHTPRYNAKALYVTHWHYDHDGGVPHLLLAGYQVDHLICNEATKMHIEDICKKLEVPREWMPKKWTIIDPLIEKKEELKISDHISLQFGWTPHSAPTSWIFVKTPEGSLFHFSDAKFDQTVESNPVFDVERLKTLKPTVVTVDSTRVDFDGPVKREADVKAEMIEFVNKNPHKAPVTVHIGTNAARMVTTADAYGETGRHTIIFGASMRFTKKVIDHVGRRNGVGLKDHAMREFGMKILNYSANAKGANEILAGDIRRQALLVTGSHNEPMSIVNRLIEDKDQKNLGFITPQKYKFIVSQTGIPGSERGYNKLIDFLKRRGYEYIISHASGHGGRQDIRDMLNVVGARYGIATHGDAQKRKNSVGLIAELGMIPIDPSEQDIIQISDRKGCSIIGQDKSMMTYFTIKRPADQHYGGGEDVEYFTKIVAPEIKTPIGAMIESIADIRDRGIEEKRRLARYHATIDQPDAVLNIEGADLRPKKRRVTQSLPDFYIHNGFMRGITYDTETTQLGKYAWIHQFAARQNDLLNPSEVKWVNYYQILPRTILPDLNALFVTGILPSELYEEPLGSRTKNGAAVYTAPDRKGRQSFPTRLFYYKIREFLEESKRVPYVDEEGNVRHTTRLWVDMDVKTDDPSNPKNRPATDRAYETQTASFTLNPAQRKDLKNPRAVNIKTFLEGANIFNADNRWMQHLAFIAGDLRYSPMNSGGIRSSDIRNKARMFAYLRPDKFKVRPRPDNPEFLDFTVAGLIAANKISLPKDARAHEGKSDVIMEKCLDDLMRSIDPELYTRMAMNANPKEVKKYFAGTHNGMVYPRHLLTYVNGSAYNARANIGVYVGRSTDRRYMNKAVLFNVSDFGPKEFIDMGPQEIAEIMSDRNHRLHRAFEIVNINKQPLIASIDRGLAVRANRGTSLEQMKANKHFIERNPEIAANMVKAMEIARHLPDHDHRLPMEERIYAPEFMEMSSHDRELAKLFIPVDYEFTDAKKAHTLNKQRAAALDKFHSKQLRERYVAVMYRVEYESELLFGEQRRYLHPADHALMKAREKARIHGRADNDAISLGRLQHQIAEATKNWDTLTKDKTPKEKERMKKILEEAKILADFIDERINANDPDWALTPEDLKLLGLDDNINYGDYRTPLAKNPNAARAPRPKAA